MRCATCVHWKPPTDREDFLTVIGPTWDEDRDESRDQLFGLCDGVREGWTVPDSEPAPLAVTVDGSQYRADLYTQAEFGCAMHEEKR